MIDTAFPSLSEEVDTTSADYFTVDQEKELIDSLLKGVNISGETINDLWENVAGSDEVTEAAIKAKIPESVQSLLPHYHNLTLSDLVRQVNFIRSLDAAVLRHRPEKELKAQITYIKAGESTDVSDQISPLSKREVLFHEIDGDHFSILKQPAVNQIKHIINLPAFKEEAS